MPPTFICLVQRRSSTPRAAALRTRSRGAAGMINQWTAQGRHLLTFLCNTDAIRRRPAQSSERTGTRPVLAPYPTLVPNLVQNVENVRIVDLAHARLVPARYSGDLHVLQQPYAVGECLRKPPLRQLHVIDIQMQEQVVAADLLDDAARLFGVVEEIAVHAFGGIARPVAHQTVLPVDRLDHSPHTMPLEER